MTLAFADTLPALDFDLARLDLELVRLDLELVGLELELADNYERCRVETGLGVLDLARV